jgi:hypothetical protein
MRQPVLLPKANEKLAFSYARKRESIDRFPGFSGEMSEALRAFDFSPLDPDKEPIAVGAPGTPADASARAFKRTLSSERSKRSNSLGIVAVGEGRVEEGSRWTAIYVLN